MLSVLVHGFSHGWSGWKGKEEERKEIKTEIRRKNKIRRMDSKNL